MPTSPNTEEKDKEKRGPAVSPDTNPTKKIEDFIKEPEAGAKGADKVRCDPLPWKRGEVSSRVIKPFNLRIPEPDFVKMKFVVERSRSGEKVKYRSVHALCMDAIMDRVNKELAKILKGK